MEDKKNIGKTVVRRQSSSCCWSFAVTLCILSAVTSFGVLNYLQFEEIWKLKFRIEQLESFCKLQKEERQTEEQDVKIETARSRRSVSTGSMTSLITNLVQQEVAVLQQYCGNSSKICLPGPKGEIGLKGDKGDVGMSGPPGPKGHQGQYGVPGVPGIKGDKGDKGDNGTKGEKGDLGAPGLPGRKGEQGNYGVPGIPGIKGEPGAAGLTGMKGQKGEEGRPLPFNQQCCSSLSKPQYLGNRTETIKVYVGQSVVLPCQTSGYPPPSVTFTPTVDPTGRNRYSISTQGMTIQSVELGDSGQYKCQIDNILGTSEKIINLVVTDPVITTITPTTLDVTEGAAINIGCDVSGSPPPVVTWQHVRTDGQVVPVTPQSLPGGRTVVSIPAARPVDAGTYTCTGSNQYETDVATTTVRVTAKPQIIDPPQTLTALDGSTVTLHCGVVSNPPATITWTYPLTGSKPPLNAYVNPDNSLTLTAVDSFNSGTYTCTATNARGSSIAQAKLTVEQGLDVTVTPHLVPLTGAEVILDFQCQAKGTPTPSIAWTKDGAPLTSGSKYALTTASLIVTGVDINTDTGVYECTGSNKNGNSTDKSIAYRDNGQLTCLTTFNQTNCSIGQFCGGKCPANCVLQGQNIYGYKAYESESPVCVAAQHTGTLPNTNNLVLWQHRGVPASYSAVLNNGIQSNTHAQTPDSYLIIQSPGTGSPAPRPLIG